MENWSVDNVAKWLSTLGKAYEGYVDAFIASGIDGELLLEIDDDLLDDLGVKKIHKRKIMMALEKNKPQNLELVLMSDDDKVLYESILRYGKILKEIENRALEKIGVFPSEQKVSMEKINHTSGSRIDELTARWYGMI